LAERGLFFFQAEDGIRDKLVTGVQTCALPISCSRADCVLATADARAAGSRLTSPTSSGCAVTFVILITLPTRWTSIGRGVKRSAERSIVTMARSVRRPGQKPSQITDPLRSPGALSDPG